MLSLICFLTSPAPVSATLCLFQHLLTPQGVWRSLGSPSARHVAAQETDRSVGAQSKFEKRAGSDSGRSCGQLDADTPEESMTGSVPRRPVDVESSSQSQSDRQHNSVSHRRVSGNGLPKVCGSVSAVGTWFLHFHTIGDFS